MLGTEVSASKIVADLVIAALTIRSPGAAVVSARAGKPAIRPRLPIAPKGAVAPLDPALTIRGIGLAWLCPAPSRPPCPSERLPGVVIPLMFRTIG